jgi:outer membrane cobalamin receptor
MALLAMFQKTRARLAVFKKLFKVVLLIFLLCPGKICAQDQATTPPDTVKNFYELSLEELWNYQVEIASKKSQSQSEAPSIVTVITSEEIQKYGYKDLADVLRMVPGFEFGVDVQGLYGLGFRGIWAHEGKAQILINGMSVNCFGFGNGNYFGTYPIALVDRIEILRGPGSAIYGEFAEVAVVNVITKKGDKLDGAEMLGTVGSINGALTTNGSISAGFSKNDMDFSATITSNSTPVSTEKYWGFSGDTINMGNKSSWRKFTGINLRGAIKNLKFGYNRSYTNFLAQDGFGTVIPKSSSGEYTNELNNKTESFNVQYLMEVNDKISITPKLDFAAGNPISSAVNSNFSSAGFFNGADPWQNQSVLGNRAQVEVSMEDRIDDRSTLLGGVGYQYNHLRSITVNGNPGLQTSQDASDTTNSYGKATKYLYLQYSYQQKMFGVTAGARYESTPFGNAFAPRIGFVFLASKFNAKVLYGRAFRAPVFWQAYSRQFNVSTGDPLKPEFSDSYELELGYRISDNVKISTNVFYIDIETPIVYLGSTNSYQNFGEVQSLGLESELQVKLKDFKAFVNFSFAVPGKNTTKDFLNEAKDRFLAMPTIKANIGGYYTKNKFSISLSGTYLGKRYGQTNLALYDTQEYDPIFLVNSNLIFTVSKTLQFNVGGYNLFNEKYVAIQPYYGGHAPLPASSQQFNFGVKITL